MGARFVAVLVAVALGAGSALVGMTMATGTWTTLAADLEPGKGYAVKLGAEGDRLRLELKNASGGASASVSVYAPAGERVGHFALDAGARAVEVSAGEGVWMVFVYKAFGADLALSVHGFGDAGQLADAIVERREVVLGEALEPAASNRTYAALLTEEPVLAGVYLRGSARGFQSELRSARGVVEVVSEQQVSAASTGVVVESQGSRATFPENLASGAYQARVGAEEMRGTLLLVALHLRAPAFPEPAPPEEPEQPTPPSRPRPPARPEPEPEEEFAVCGEVRARAPFALEAEAGQTLRLALRSRMDPRVSIFDPLDALVGVVRLEQRGEERTFVLEDEGEYVLYARGGAVEVALRGAEECELRELSTESVTVAEFRGEDVAERKEAEANFSLGLAPIEFGVRVDGAAVDLEAVFEGPLGEAAVVRQTLALGSGEGFGAGSEDMAAQRGEERARGMARVKDPALMVEGPWVLHVEADLLRGDLDAFALHYVRGSMERDA